VIPPQEKPGGLSPKEGNIQLEKRIVKMSEVKALALMSGGLDSVLAVALLLKQGVKIIGLHFNHPLCSAPERPGREKHVIDDLLRDPGLEVRQVDMGDEYEEIVRKPRFGRGTGMNPCIDCHAFMLAKAARMMTELGAAFIMTGEVLGQRPMSQHRQALDLIERHTNLKGKLLRPLSALLMEPTDAENAGLIDRSKLLDIKGRGRGRQIQLAREYGIENYPAPAGGCMLTDRNFAERLEDSFEHLPSPLDHSEIELLKIGRHYRLPSGAKAVIGRESFENERIEGIASLKYLRLIPANFPGPSGVVSGGSDDEIHMIAAAILHFSPKAGAEPKIEMVDCDGLRTEVTPVSPFSYPDFARFSIGAS